MPSVPSLHKRSGRRRSMLLGVNAWEIELIAARGDREQRAAARDAARGRFRRVRAGIYVPADALAGGSTQDLHLIGMRALALASDRPLVFSHWSSAVAHDRATLGNRFGRVHVTFSAPGLRSFDRVAGHVFALQDCEVEEVHGLLVTTIGRTVVDIAGAGTFEEGVVTADSALAGGLTRDRLDHAVDLAGPRRAWRSIAEVVAFADGGGKSAGESVSRVTMVKRLGLHPVLQHPLFDRRGRIGDTDFFFPDEEVAGEFDGLVKYLDPRYAPMGAGKKAYDEKVREDRGRRVTRGWARWGWAEGRDARLLGSILASAGVRVPRLVR